MQLARVAGTVVATIKDGALESQKLLLLRQLDANGGLLPRTLVALDAIGAGVGETVYYCRGKESSFPWLPAAVPTDATVVGIVDPASNPHLFPSPQAHPGEDAGRRWPRLRRSPR